MFTHVSIKTSNLEKSITFYNKFFGLKILNRIPVKKTQSEIVFLQDPTGKGCKLELTFSRNQTGFIQPPYEQRLFDHLGFEVHDIKATVGEMRKEGIEITDEPYMFSENGPVIAFVEDPDGTLIELIQEV